MASRESIRLNETKSNPKIGKSEDGVIEAIAVPGKRFAAAVQWHPEMMYDNEQQQSLFIDFVEACSP